MEHRVKALENSVSVIEAKLHRLRTRIDRTWERARDKWANPQPVGDGWGLWERQIEHLGLDEFTDHFRSGSIPDGFSWINDGDFNGTPTALDYDYKATYLIAACDTTPHFIADAISTYEGKSFYARLRTGQTTDIGIRLDDGSTDSYAEIYLDALGTGEYQVKFRYDEGATGETEANGPTYPCTQFVTVRLYYYTTTPAVFGYTVVDDTYVNITGFTTGAISWTPARIGLAIYNDSGNYAFCDWFYNEFT